MNNYLYPRGSEWRKWDLHVHTPESVLNNHFGSDWDTYVKTLFKKAIEREISVIGITDYFCAKGYKILKKDYLSNDHKLKEIFEDNECLINNIKQICVLPNVEFRLNTFVGGRRIDFHVIFSEAVPIEYIEKDFIERVCFGFDSCEKERLTEENLIKLGRKLQEEHDNFKGLSSLKVGMENATVDIDEIIRVLRESPSKFNGNYLLALPPDEDLSGISWDGQDHQARKLLIQKTNLLFASNPNTIEWSLGEKHSTPQGFIKEFKSLKPCIWGSDAHDFNKLFEPDENRHTWIKADPTFEGLKQITYEPESRVKIQDSIPQNEHVKPYFSHIKIGGGKIFDKPKPLFQTIDLPLNPNMVAIIGGRGTGKSLLLDALAHIFGGEESKPLVGRNVRDIHLDSSLKVTYTKQDGETKQDFTVEERSINDLNYLHIRQGDVKDITVNALQLDKEVKKLLNLHLEEGTSEEDGDFNRLLSEFVEIQSFLKRRNEQGEEVNSENAIAEQKNRHQRLVESLTTEKNKTLIKRYVSNSKASNQLVFLKKSLDTLQVKMTQASQDLNRNISSVNEGIKAHSTKAIKPIHFNEQAVEIKDIQADLDSKIDEIRKEIDGVEAVFKKERIEGDLQTLLDNVGAYRKKIDECNKKLEDIKQKIARKNELLKLSLMCAKRIRDTLNNQIQVVNDGWRQIKEGKEGWSKQQKTLIDSLLKDITINGVIRFEQSDFLKAISDSLNKQKFRASAGKSSESRIAETFPIESFDDYISLLCDKRIISIDGAKRFAFLTL